MSKEGSVAALAAVSGLGGVTAAASCCVLPLALASAGVGASAFAAVVPFQTPLSILAALAVVIGWFLYFRRKRACASGTCEAPPATSTAWLLGVATLFIGLSAIWPWLEAPLMRAFS